MNAIQYISAAGLCLAVTWLTSAILFRKGTDFRIQRVFIVLAVIFSLVLPFSRFSIELHDFRKTSAGPPFTEIGISADTGAIPLQPEESGVFASAAGYLVWIYYITIAVWLLALLIQLARILFLYSVSVRDRRGSLTVLTSSSIKTPFSFFSMIFIPGDISDVTERESIIIHESIHASQYHSFDNLLIELLTAVMWFNPFVWMIRRSLHLVHEYLADEGTLGAGIDRIRYQALLINQVTEERLICLSSDFNNKLLKKRMIMMTNFKQRKEGLGRLPVILPLTLLMFMAVSVLNGFFPPEIIASDPDGFTILKSEPIVVYEPLVQKDTTDKAKIRIRRTPEASKMDDVMVVGYGKSNDSSNVSPVIVVDGVYVKNTNDLDPEEISSVNVNKEDNIVIIRTKSYAGRKAAPDAGVVIRSRGSVTENTLYIIDEKKTDKTTFQSLDPSDIESISVLKGESMRIYTDEDYDGVIIIKTKRESK